MSGGERDRSGKRSGAGRKLSERELSGERTKLAAQISLKCGASLLKLRRSILLISLNSGTYTRQIKNAEEYQKWWCLLNHIMYTQYG